MALYRLELRCLSRRAPEGTRPRERQDRCRPSLTIRGQRSITAAAAYRAAALMPVRGDDQAARVVADFRRRRGVDARPILAPEDAPDWARQRETLWAEVDAREKRPDALLAREFILTLPVEAPLDATTAAAERWAKDELVDKEGMVADVTVHRYGAALDLRREENRERVAELERDGWPVVTGDVASDDARLTRPHVLRPNDQRAYVYQPHAHVLVTTRPFRRRQFSNKERSWGQKAQLYRWRQSWEQTYNRLLDHQGVETRVDCRAQWRRQKQKARSPNLTTALRASVQPPVRTLHLGGGAFGARRGRAPAASPDPDHRQRRDRPKMTPDEFNRALTAARGHKPTPQTASTDPDLKDWKKLHDLVDFAHELEAEGVRFFENPQRGTLSYAAPDERPLQPEEYRRFKAMHEPVVLVLREHGTLCPDKEDAERQVADARRRTPEQPGDPSPMPGVILDEAIDEPLDLSDITTPTADGAPTERGAPSTQQPTAPTAPRAEPGAGPQTAAPQPAPSTSTAPPRGRSKLRQQLEPLFKAARAGSKTATPEDPEVAWIAEEFAQEARGRREAEETLARARDDLGEMWGHAHAAAEVQEGGQRDVHALGRLEKWLRFAWERVVAGDGRTVTPDPAMIQASRTSLELVDPKDKAAQSRRLGELRKLSPAEKLRKIMTGLKELNHGNPETEKIRAGLIVLNAALSNKDRETLPPEVRKQLDALAQPGSRQRTPGRSGPTRGPDRGFR
jgi:hypothetical protein